jgi:hypothetical protein
MKYPSPNSPPAPYVNEPSVAGLDHHYETVTRRRALTLGASGLLSLAGCAGWPGADGGYTLGPRLHVDNFRDGPGRRRVELEREGAVTVRDGVLEIDTSGGCSVWFREELQGPVMIQYDAVAVAEGEPNDHVSDLNCFWMATDPGAPAGVPPRPRSGAFADYDDLLAYYVGQGGNRNTTTRMRRYVGQVDNRPLLPQHDLSDPEHMLRPNVHQTVQLVAAGPQIEYWRNGVRVFELDDPRAYTRGWFAIRTTANRLRISNFSVHALQLRGSGL